MATILETASSKGPETAVNVKKEKKEKKDKKRKAAGEAVDGETTKANVAGDCASAGEVVEESKEERRARKKAKKLAKEEAQKPETDVVAPAMVEETKEERKARRRAEKLAKSLATDDAPEAPAEASTSKKTKGDKKSKKVENGEAESADAAATGTEDKMSKKEKKKAARASAAIGSAQGDEPQAGSSSNPIFSDDSLTDQAKKAIYYVELHAATQAKLPDIGERWKFNKAKQGWLMRNVWNDTEVPDAYFEKVVFYLKTLPGLARKGMIETAKKHAKAPVPGAEKPAEEGQTAEEGEAEGVEDEGKAQSAGAGPDAAEQEDDDDEGGGDPEIVEMRRSRAQRILKALGAR